MKDAGAIDVSGLSDYAFGHRSLMWWGTGCLMAIEGAVFAITIVVYFYLRERVPQWPVNAVPPFLFWGTLNTVILLASIWPNQIVKTAAEHEDLRKVRIWMTICTLFAIAFTVIRWFEFTALRVRWDTNAYGSVTWTLLGLHATHVVTDLVDTIVLLVLMFIGPITGRRFVDVSENALYWYFVVISWLPIYAVIYLAPRVL
jgi:cytochrome c oxidase subunit 3